MLLCDNYVIVVASFHVKFLDAFSAFRIMAESSASVPRIRLISEKSTTNSDKSSEIKKNPLRLCDMIKNKLIQVMFLQSHVCRVSTFIYIKLKDFIWDMTV